VLRFLEQKHALGDHRTSSIPPPPSGYEEAPPSSRISQLPEEPEPPLSIPPPSVPVPSYPGGASERQSSADLDEPPRTRRHAIITPPDED
jgi:23S rRNA (uracil1939-C5)-methyltransferase